MNSNVFIVGMVAPIQFLHYIHVAQSTENWPTLVFFSRSEAGVAMIKGPSKSGGYTFHSKNAMVICFFHYHYYSVTQHGYMLSCNSMVTC